MPFNAQNCGQTSVIPICNPHNFQSFVCPNIFLRKIKTKGYIFLSKMQHKKYGENYLAWGLEKSD